jgi:hypothetical protein
MHTGRSMFRGLAEVELQHITNHYFWGLEARYFLFKWMDDFLTWEINFLLQQFMSNFQVPTSACWCQNMT